MQDLNFILDVLVDYCELQTTGLIAGAGRYAASDVKEQIALVESGELSGVLEIQKLLSLPENSLAAAVLQQRNQLKELGVELEQLKLRNDALSSQVGSLNQVIEHIQDERDEALAKLEQTTLLASTAANELIKTLEEKKGLVKEVNRLKGGAFSAFGDGFYEGYLQYADDCGNPDYKGDALRRSEMAESKSVYGQENAAVARLAERDFKVTIKSVEDFCDTMFGYQDVYTTKDKMGIATSLSHHRDGYISQLKLQAGVK